MYSGFMIYLLPILTIVKALPKLRLSPTSPLIVRMLKQLAKIKARPYLIAVFTDNTERPIEKVVAGLK